MTELHRDYVLVLNAHVPPGLVDMNAQHGMQFGLLGTMGKQNSIYPDRNTSVRPNIETTYFYDEDGEITGIDGVAEAWLVSGDWSDETWDDEDELIVQVAWALLDYFELPDNQFLPMRNTLDCYILTHEGMISELTVNAALWGESVG